MKGAFFTFEGVEGSGKSTQIERLQNTLQAQGRNVDLTREPGGTPIAELIRGVLLDPAHTEMNAVAELLLYEAARAQHVEERIRPALNRGTIVLCDRYIDSTAAYQGAGRGLNTSDLETLQRIATGGLLPDRTFLIDLPVEEGLARASKGEESDRIERESLEFHEQVRVGFLELAKKEPDRIRVIDGLGTPDEIAEEIGAIVNDYLNSLR